MVSDSIGVVSGTSATLESLETSFHQDLNNDGVIGAPATALSVQAGVPTSLSATTAIAPASADVPHVGTAATDSFVFRYDPGNGKIGTDAIDLDHTAFAGVSDLFPRTAGDAHGNEVPAIAADQMTYEIPNLLLQQHLTDFHLV